jgi:maltose-binding protein MalE
MEECMKKKQLGVIGALASAALIASAMLVPAANASSRTLTIWADDQRGPQLTTLLQGNTSIVPGYKINVKFFSSLNALQSAWSNATAATAPDIYAGALNLASDVQSGKLAPIQLGSTANSFPTGAISFVSTNDHIYGIPLDTDGAALEYNKALVPTAPTSFASMVNYYLTNKSSKGLTAGLCTVDGSWEDVAVMNALGGGAWDISKSKPNYSTVEVNNPTMLSNVKTYLLGSDGKSNGFWQGYADPAPEACLADFDAGKIPFAITGAWNYAGMTAKGINFGISAIPGVKAGTYGAQFIGYTGAYLTSFASTHGVAIGARQLLVNWFASTQGQLAMSKLSQRPPASSAAVAAATDPNTIAVGNAFLHGQPQVDVLLNDAAGGTAWYATISSLWSAVLTQGKDLSTSADLAASIEQKDFADALK